MMAIQTVMVNYISLAGGVDFYNWLVNYNTV